jgi:hypothetical protein
MMIHVHMKIETPGVQCSRCTAQTLVCAPDLYGSCHELTLARYHENYMDFM